MNRSGIASVKDSESSVFNNFPVNFLKNNIFLIAIICFVFGFLFQNPGFVQLLLKTIYEVTGKQLDYSFRLIGFTMTGQCLLLFGFLLTTYKITGGSQAILLKNKFHTITIFSIVFFYWNFLLKNAVNIPVTDDYFTVLNFLNSFIYISNFEGLWQMIFNPYVETRNVVTKLLVIGSWKITGLINFKWFIIIINAALSGIAYLIYLSTDKIDFRKELIIPIMLFIFQFSFYDAQLWSTAGIHIVLTLFFSFLTFFFLNRDKIGFLFFALLTALLASFTYGNGLLVFPIGLLILFVKKRKEWFITWLLFFLLLLLVYFYNYHFNIQMLDADVASIVSKFVYCLAFWGSAFQFMYRLELPVFTGIIFFLIFLWITIKKYYVQNPVNYSMMLFIIFSAAMASFFRIQTADGIQQALSNRYVIYSCLAVCSSLIAIAELNTNWFKKKMLSRVFIFAAIYYLSSAFFFYPETELRKQKLMSFSESVTKNQAIKYSPPVIPAGADTIIKSAVKNGIYKP